MPTDAEGLTREFWQIYIDNHDKEAQRLQQEVERLRRQAAASESSPQRSRRMRSPGSRCSRFSATLFAP